MFAFSHTQRNRVCGALLVLLGALSCSQTTGFFPTVDEQFTQRVDPAQVLVLDSYDFGEWQKIGTISLQVDSHQGALRGCRRIAAKNGGEAITEIKVLNQSAGSMAIAMPQYNTSTQSQTSSTLNAGGGSGQTPTSTSSQTMTNSTNVTSGGQQFNIPFTVMDIQCSVLIRRSGIGAGEDIPEEQPSEAIEESSQPDETVKPPGEGWFCTSLGGKEGYCSRVLTECRDIEKMWQREAVRSKAKVMRCRKQMDALCATFRRGNFADFGCFPTGLYCEHARDVWAQDSSKTAVSPCGAW